MEAIKEEKKKPPEQRIWLGIIQPAFEDGLNYVWVITYLWQRYNKQGTGSIPRVVLMLVTTQVQPEIIYRSYIINYLIDTSVDI